MEKKNLMLNQDLEKSLFRDIDGMERNCQKYEELTENDLCRCIKN